MLNYQALYYLLEVSAAQSFTLAAEKLHMTRPALSTAIKNLEKELGFLLLNRNHDGVTLTKQGESVVQLAQKGFVFFNEIEHMTTNKPVVSAELSVYSTLALTSTFMPALIKNYYEQHPDGTFNAHTIGNAMPDEILLQHPDSFVLGIFNEARQFHENVQTIVLDKSKTYLAMSHNATFFPADVKSIALKELLHVPLITTTVLEEQSFQNELLTALRKYGEPNIRFTASSMDMGSSLVAERLGVTFFPVFKLLQNTSTANFRTIRIKNAPKFVLAALYHKDMPQEQLDFFLSLLNQI